MLPLAEEASDVDVPALLLLIMPLTGAPDSPPNEAIAESHALCVARGRFRAEALMPGRKSK